MQISKLKEFEKNSLQQEILFKLLLSMNFHLMH